MVWFEYKMKKNKDSKIGVRCLLLNIRVKDWGFTKIYSSGIFLIPE